MRNHRASDRAPAPSAPFGAGCRDMGAHDGAVEHLDQMRRPRQRGKVIEEGLEHAWAWLRRKRDRRPSRRERSLQSSLVHPRTQQEMILRHVTLMCGKCSSQNDCLRGICTVDLECAGRTDCRRPRRTRGGCPYRCVALQRNILRSAAFHGPLALLMMCTGRSLGVVDANRYITRMPFEAPDGSMCRSNRHDKVVGLQLPTPSILRYK